MRRWWVVLAFALMVFPLLGVSGSEEADYADDFGDGDYHGNDGSLDFAGPWSETGDDGSPSSGAIHVGSEWCSNNRCAHFESDGPLLGSLALDRFADLSDFTEATLTFDLAVLVEDPLGLNTAEFQAQVMSGGSWTTVRTYGLTQSFEGTKTIDVTGHAGEDFGVRFIIPGLVEGSVANFVGGLSVDRVEIFGLVGNPTTTTSSTSTTTTSTSTSTTSSTTTQPTSSSTTSTTTASTTTSNVSESAPGESETTTTTVGPAESTTTTTLASVVAVSPTPPNSGLVLAGPGVMADYEEGAMGTMSTETVEVLGVGVTADFSMAVEVFESVRWWIAGLALLIVAATIGLVDRRRTERSL